MKRREFVKTTGAFTVGSFLFSNCVFSMNQKEDIGLQLYTIRGETSKDIAFSLEKIAEIGYNSVEAANYANRKFYGLKPQDFKTMVNSFGMELHATHSDVTVDNDDQVIEDTVEAGIPYLVMPWLHPDKRKDIDSYKQLSENFNIIGEKCNNAGITFAYHNHDFEFNTLDNQIPYDLLLNETEIDLVKMQLDIFWIKKAGYDPINYFKKYPGRFELWHIKDMDNTAKAENIEVGKGIIDFKEIFEYKNLAGMKLFFIELDNCILPPYECIGVSYDNMKSIVNG